MEILIGFAPFLLFFAWLMFAAARPQPRCPDCQRPLEFFQSPWTKTRRQWARGGYLCSNCGCQTDTAGCKVAKSETAPRAWVVFSILPAILLPGLIVAYLLWIA